MNPVEILDRLLKKKKSVSRKKFLNLLKRFGGFKSWDGSRRFGEMFTWGGFYIVMPDNNEFNLERIVEDHDNHGHMTLTLDILFLKRILWKRMCHRPADMNLSSAFQLADKFRDKKGRVRLSRHVRKHYKHTFVGNRNEGITFPEFCRQMNGVFLSKPELIKVIV
jgi:hypothetical protein